MADALAEVRFGGTHLCGHGVMAVMCQICPAEARAKQFETAAQAMDREITRLKDERSQLRHALLDALTVFEIDPRTEFRKSYAALIERAQRNIT